MQKLALAFLLLPVCLFAQKTPASTANKPAISKPALVTKPAPATNTPAAKPLAKPSAALAAKPTTSAVTKDTAILRLFEKPAEIKWVKVFKGRLDDASVVDLTLGFDGRNCRGYLTYAQSRIRFTLAGPLDTAGFLLEERDMSLALTGRLRGVYHNRHLSAEWLNANNTLGTLLEADEVSPGQALTLNCSDNKWSSRYITRFNGARADMVLVRSHNGALDGFLWVEADGRTYRLKGDIKPDETYELEALGAGDRLAALLSGRLKPGQNTDCNWVGSGERRTFKFILKDHFLLGCYEWADYATSYDVLYPRTPCAHCNTWLDEKMNEWVSRCKSTFAEKKIGLVAANRASERASAWPEIVCWTENIFAGYVTYSDTWSEQAQGIAFNFDLKTNKEITFEDIFNKGFNAQKWLADYANREMPKIASFGADPKYREWLTKEGFPLFALRREGLEISTLFHPQYGRQALLVPYSTLRAYLKKDGVLADFIK